MNIIATFDNYEFDDNERNDFKIKINNARKEEEDKYKTFLNKVLNDGSWREGLHDGVIEIIEDKESSEDITAFIQNVNEDGDAVVKQEVETKLAAEAARLAAEKAKAAEAAEEARLAAEEAKLAEEKANECLKNNECYDCILNILENEKMDIQNIKEYFNSDKNVKLMKLHKSQIQEQTQIIENLNYSIQKQEKKIEETENELNEEEKNLKDIQIEALKIKSELDDIEINKKKLIENINILSDEVERIKNTENITINSNVKIISELIENLNTLVTRQKNKTVFIRDLTEQFETIDNITNPLHKLEIAKKTILTLEYINNLITKIDNINVREDNLYKNENIIAHINFIENTFVRNFVYFYLNNHDVTTNIKFNTFLNKLINLQKIKVENDEQKKEIICLHNECIKRRQQYGKVIGLRGEEGTLTNQDTANVFTSIEDFNKFVEAHEKMEKSWICPHYCGWVGKDETELKEHLETHNSYTYKINKKAMGR